MLSLPSKPWKKVRIEQLSEREYRITFVSSLADEAEFLEAVKNDLGSCVGTDDGLGTPDWGTRSVQLSTASIAAFKRRLVFASIVVETE
ncbi:MAG: hypothetical protein M5U08_19310 [Burkholderiales bacterium]|nr:hypothetical protein [Burkholderiales bacterium]